MKFSESHVEDAALEWLPGLGYAVLHGPDISPDGPTPRDPFRRALFPEMGFKLRNRPLINISG